MRSQPQSKEPLFNSKELNKILPSYLLDEIDEEQKELNHNQSNQQGNLVLPKDIKKVKNIIFYFIILYYRL